MNLHQLRLACFNLFLNLELLSRNNKTLMDNILQDLQNSSYPTKAKFNNYRY